MYDIKEINKALRLLKQYDYQFVKVSIKLGIPVTTLRMWFRKYKDGITIVKSNRIKKSKWSDEEKKKINYVPNQECNLLFIQYIIDSTYLISTLDCTKTFVFV